MKNILLIFVLIIKILGDCYERCSTCSPYIGDFYYHNCTTCIEGTYFLSNTQSCYYIYELPGFFLNSDQKYYNLLRKMLWMYKYWFMLIL